MNDLPKLTKLKEHLERTSNPNKLVQALAIYEAVTDIGKIILNLTTISLSIHSPDNYTNRRNIYAFLEWVKTQNIKGTAKELMLNEEWMDGWSNVVSNSDSKRYFIYKNRLFWYEFSNETLRSNTLAHSNEMKLIITGLTRNIKLLHEMSNECMYKRKRDEINNYIWNSEWKEIGTVVPRLMKTVALKKDIKEKILKELQDFKAKREWYLENGIPHKFSILLEGPSGSGKTSLSRAIATYLNYNLYSINIQQMTDNSLLTALTSTIKGKSIVLVEDFEKATCVQKSYKEPKVKILNDNTTGELNLENKQNLPENESIKNNASEEINLLTGGLTRTGYLNAIDGAITLDDIIIIFSSNDISNIDEAVLRDGRMDLKIRIGELSDTDIKDFIKDMVDIEVTDKIFKPMMGSKLSKLFRNNCWDSDKFIESIPTII